MAALLSVVLTLLLIALALGAWLLLTTSGARWLVGWATDLEPRLAMTVDGGALATGLEVSTLAWRDRDVDVVVARAELEWTPGCLLSAALCLDRLALSGARVRLRPSDDDTQSAPQPQGSADIRLPLPIRLGLLQVSDARVVLPDAELAVRSLQASGSVDESTLAVDWLRIEGLDVAAAPAPKETDAASGQRVELPAVDLPLDLVVQNALLETADLRIGDQQVLIEQLALSASLRGSRLDVERLQLAAPRLQAEAAGSITLAGGYPLSVRVTADADAADLPRPLRLAAAFGGSVEQLAVTVDLEAPVALRAEADLRPLAEGLPFDLRARWQAIALPLQDAPVAELRDGELQLAGDLSGYRGSAAVTVVSEQTPDGRWRADVAGDLDQLRISRLQGETLAGRIGGEGELRWRDGLRWQALLEGQGLDPSRHWPDYPGRISGKLDVRGQVGEDGLSFTAATTGIQGRLRGYPLALSGTVGKTADGTWRFDRLRLVSGDNRVEVDGRLEDDGWDLQGRFRLPNPGALLPDVAGSASGRFAVRGAIADPDLTLDLEGSGLRYSDYALAGIELHAEVRRLGFERSRVRWNASGVHVGEQRVERVRGELVGDREQHALTLDVDGADYGGELRLRGSLDDELNWVGRLLDAAVQLPPRQQWRLNGPAALRWNQSQRQLSLEAHCWRQEGARLCLTETATLGERGALQLALTDFPVEWLALWLPQGVTWRAPLDGAATVRWQPDAPLNAHVLAGSRNGRILLDQEDDDPLALEYDRIDAQLTVDRGSLDASVELASQRLGAGRVEVRTRLEPSPRPLDGRVALEGLQLSLLQAFLPEAQTLSGAVSLRGRLDGTLQDPGFVGDVRVVDGRFAAPNLPMTLTAVELQAEFAGGGAQLNGSFQSGDGGGRVRGRADWAGPSWRLDLAVEGERLRFVYEPVARLQVSPDLQIRVQPQQVAIEGRVVVPSGEITLRALPEGAVGVSDDVIVINRRDGPAAAEPLEPAPGWSVTTDVELVLGDDVAIAGYGLEGRLAGNLRVRQRPDGVPEAAGELRIEDGQYRAYGQQLEIRQGQLLFSGPIREPSLNIEAVRRAADVVAGLRVEGEPEAPAVSLFSEPALPQEQILSYLIRGRGLDEGGGGQEQLLTQAALSLGIFGGKGFASSLAKELGVEDFELGTRGEGEETQVELSGYIAPDLLVRYGIGVFEPVNTLTLRYRINDNFFVEAVSGLDSALDFFYEFEF